MATGFWDEGAGVDAPLPATDWVSGFVGKHMDHLCVSDIMDTNPVLASPEESLVDLARRTIKRKASRAFVLDDGHFFGVVSAFDLLRIYSE